MAHLIIPVRMSPPEGVRLLIMTGKNGHKSAEMKPWERQERESDKAFAAFRVYLEMGPKRSLRAVAQKLGKSVRFHTTDR